MHNIVVSVPLTAETHQILSGATRRLGRILGPRKAPDVVALIQHELNGRSVRGVVDEYLDAIGWSLPVRLAPLAVSVRRGRSVRTRARALPLSLRSLRGPRIPADLSRN